MLNKIIETINKLPEVQSNKIYSEQAISDATQMFTNGWNTLEDGLVVSYKGNQVAVKNGNTIIINMMNDFSINLGKINGNVDHQVKIMEIPEAKKEAYLAQAIITKYYTLKKA